MTQTQRDSCLLDSVWVLGLTLIACLPPTVAHADRIILRGGGQIRGEVVPDPARKDRVTVITETGKTPLIFEKAKVVQIVEEATVLDDYLVEKRKAAATA